MEALASRALPRVVPGAVLVRQDVASWIIERAVGLTPVMLAALLWSSRQP